MSSVTPSNPRRQTVLGEYLTDPKVSAFRKYQDLVVGERGVLALLRYEVLTGLLRQLPGALGLALRGVFYPWLLGRSGPGVVFGEGVTLRHPSRIDLGGSTIVDSDSVLDAKGEAEVGIQVGRGCLIGRSSVLSCKGGTIRIGDSVNLGLSCVILSESEVEVGSNCIFAAQAYLVAGDNHDFTRTDLPIIQQPSLSKGGIRIEENVWLGARVTVLDGVTIGHDSVVGAGAVVTRSLPPYSVAVGVPAKIARMRT